MHINILIILSLRDCLKRFFGDHYPHEIVQLIILKFYKSIKISCGSNCTVVIADGKTYAWGENHCHQLGLGHNNNEYFPQKLGIQFSKIKCYDGDHTIALTTHSELYVWGNNNEGQLGLGPGERTGRSSSGGDYEYKTTPHKLLSNIKKINGGYRYTVALTKLNEIYAWGKNYYGGLGLGDSINYNSPQKLPLADTINSISCGYSHTIALTKNSNKIYAWGDNEYYQLGFGDCIDRLKPTELSLPLPILKSACGSLYTIVLTKCNKLFGWGSNYKGQLGLGDYEIRKTPHELTNVNDIISVKCGRQHTIALTTRGDIYGWGYNFFGQVGSNIDTSTPQKISLSNIVRISCGANHTMAVTMRNDLYVWGCNTDGQLGLGDDKCRKEPCRLDFKF